MDYDDLRKKQLYQILDRLKSERGHSSSERIKTLDQLHVTLAKDIVFIWIELLKTECDIEVLNYVCNSLARTNCKDAVDQLINLVVGDRDIDGEDDPVKSHKEEYLKVRCTAIGILGRLKEERAVITLMRILNDREENYRIRLNAAEALGRIGDTYALNPLINLVVDDKEKSIYVRESAAKALGMLGDVRAIKPLIKTLQSKRGIMDKFTFLKERIIEAVAKIGADPDRDTVVALKESLIDEAPTVRLSAVEALASLEDESLISILLPVIYDEEEDVAREAVRGVYSLNGYLELNKLLEDDRLPGWSRDEIETVLEEEV